VVCRLALIILMDHAWIYRRFGSSGTCGAARRLASCNRSSRSSQSFSANSSGTPCRVDSKRALACAKSHRSVTDAGRGINTHDFLARFGRGRPRDHPRYGRLTDLRESLSPQNGIAHRRLVRIPRVSTLRFKIPEMTSAGTWSLPAASSARFRRGG
jgi:hypothetical protein